MSTLVVKDLDHDLELDQKAMKEILGGFKPIEATQNEIRNRSVRKQRIHNRNYKYVELTTES